MNREILFRGKRMDNGEWVEGHYVNCLDILNKDVLPPFNMKDYILPSFNDSQISGVGHYEVEPATIGQFTGLLDKNGNRMFEGDIFTADEYPFVDDGRPNYYGLVEWIFAGFQYVLKLANTDKRGISDGVNEILEDAGWVEVIGNIHDEPELIKTIEG